MANIVTLQARNRILSNGITQNDHEVMLITNTSILTSSTEYSDLTELTGGGYARKTITAGAFSINNGIATVADQLFTAGVGGWSGWTGFAVVSTGVTPEIISLFQKSNPSSTYTINEGDTYTASIEIQLTV